MEIAFKLIFNQHNYKHNKKNIQFIIRVFVSEKNKQKITFNYFRKTVEISVYWKVFFYFYTLEKALSFIYL